MKLIITEKWQHKFRTIPISDIFFHRQYQTFHLFYHENEHQLNYCGKFIPFIFSKPCHTQLPQINVITGYCLCEWPFLKFYTEIIT